MNKAKTRTMISLQTLNRLKVKKKNKTKFDTLLKIFLRLALISGEREQGPDKKRGDTERKSLDCKRES
jgi:hypothetical protein